MEGGSSGNYEYCSKTSFSNQNEDDEEEEEEENEEENINGMSKPTDNGGSSSNSTVEENETTKKSSSSSVRPYVRSKTPRLRWTHDLHLRFVQAVERLGGQERATPKLVLQLMNVKGLNIAHVKSHLQMYRSKKLDEHGQDQKLLFEGGDRNIYNLSQLPMLPSFNRMHNATFRYGEAPWSFGHEKWMQSSFISRSPVDHHKGRPRFCASATDKIFGIRNSTNYDPHFNASSSSELCSRKHDEKQRGFGSICDHLQGRWRGHDLSNTTNKDIMAKSSNKMQQEAVATTSHDHYRTMFKRKISDCELDLNLTLALKSKDDEIKEQGDHLEDDKDKKYLSLSLFSLSSSSSSKKVCRLKDDHEGNETRTASTLDLTI